METSFFPVPFYNSVWMTCVENRWAWKLVPRSTPLEPRSFACSLKRKRIPRVQSQEPIYRGHKTCLAMEHIYFGCQSIIGTWDDFVGDRELKSHSGSYGVKSLAFYVLNPFRTCHFPSTQWAFSSVLVGKVSSIFITLIVSVIEADIT